MEKREKETGGGRVGKLTPEFGKSILTEELRAFALQMAKDSTFATSEKILNRVEGMFILSEGYVLRKVTNGTGDEVLDGIYRDHLSTSIIFAQGIIARTLWEYVTNFGSELAYNAFESPEAYSKSVDEAIKILRSDLNTLGQIHRGRLR